jgi:hypothetical protein
MPCRKRRATGQEFRTRIREGAPITDIETLQILRMQRISADNLVSELPKSEAGSLKECVFAQKKDNTT